MIKTLYLHIGTGKSGSTTIQNFLFGNRDLLIKNDIYFPVVPGTRHHVRIPAYATVGSRIHSILNRIDIFSEKEAIQFKTEFEAEFRAELKNCGASNAVLTSEFCFSLIQVEIDSLASLLKSVAENVKIVVYLRRQDDFWVSRYAQTIKSGAQLEKFSLPAESEINRILDYYAIVKRWEEAFGLESIIVRPFEKQQLKQGDPAKDFLSILGLKYTSEYVAPAFLNKRVDASTLEMVRRINLVLSKKNDTAQLPVAQRLRVISQEISGGEAYEVSSNDRIALMELFGEGNQKIARRYLNRESGVLFYEAVMTSYSSDTNEIDIDSAVDFAARLCVWNEKNVSYLESRIRELESSLIIHKKKRPRSFWKMFK